MLISKKTTQFIATARGVLGAFGLPMVKGIIKELRAENIQKIKKNTLENSILFLMHDQ